MSTPSLTQTIKAVDVYNRLRHKPGGWWLSALGLVAIVVCCVVGYRYTRVWVGTVNTHVQIHAPEAMQRFQALERKVDKLTEDTADMKADVRTIRDGLIRRGMADAATPTPVAVAAAPFWFELFPSAEAGVVERGPVPAGVSAADRAAGVGDRVVKEAR